MTEDDKLPEIQTFENVVVTPHERNAAGRTMPSGPIWPDWANQTLPRHCRHGFPEDREPPAPEKIEEYVDEPMIWCGMAHPHFGHFMSEFAPRILQSKQHGQGSPLLFGCSYPKMIKTGALEDTPKHFQFVLDWYGIAPEEVRFCTRVMQVKTLKVASQAEQLVSLTRKKDPPGVAAEYLDLLDENTARNAFEPIPSKAVFVSRGGMPAFRGNHLGAKYFDTVLESLGVTVYYPERNPLGHQIATYAGADELIFAEGSAIHGCQILGRSFNNLSILNRRTDTRLVEKNMKPRCKNFSFIDALSHVFIFNDPNNKPMPAFAMAKFDLDKLFSDFKARGIDLASVWNMDVYNQAVEDSLMAWITATQNRPNRQGVEIDQSTLIATLRQAGHHAAADHLITLLP